MQNDGNLFGLGYVLTNQWFEKYYGGEPEVEYTAEMAAAEALARSQQSTPKKRGFLRIGGLGKKRSMLKPSYK
jgi:hypothetical protein